MQTSSSGQPAVRTTTTTVWLWIVIILNAVAGVGSLSMIGTLTDLGISPTWTIVSALLCFGTAVGAFMILKWKKMGFYIITGCVVLNIIVALLGEGNVGTTIFSAILSLAVLYYVLQYPKDNKAWDHLA